YFHLAEEETDAHSSMSKITRFVVKGRVQGVGLRWATREQALQRGLCGWVQNCSDGSVEILAKGAENSLSSLKTWFWQGSSGSRVSEIHVTLEEEESVPDTFYIR
ncbi:MAG: acylphosphatase, partial [Acidobacteria bacterium]|nr:acylphosphatase [Acidobacteriota bacterium]